MKKTLALVLALIMVLALVPAAFAQDIHTITPGEYEVSVQFQSNGADSVDANYLKTATFSAKGTAPAVTVTAPFNNIDNAQSDSIWHKAMPTLQVTVKNLGGTQKFWNGVAGKVYVNGTELKVTSAATPTEGTCVWNGADSSITFNTQITSASAVYSYQVVLKYDTTDVLTTETMNFTIAYTNNQKPVYDLKFNQPVAGKGVVLKDGVYFIDSATSAINSAVDKFAVNVAKNDGSKFTEVAYYAEAIDAYPAMNSIYVRAENTVTADSTLDIKPAAMTAQKPDTAYKTYVVVETEYAFYKGILTYKYRTNVERVDPKGISFAKSEYTIGKNEVLVPTYNSVATVYHDLATYTTLSLFGNSDKNVIDVDGNKITGLKDGTVYVKATYIDSLKVYTDTAKITVKGEYQVTDKANYKVTTKSGNLNVRASASTSAKKIGSLKKGDVVEVVEIKNGWAKIIYPAANYTNGYVSAQYLTKEGTKPETVVGTKTVIARVLNVRSGAGTSYSIVGKLTRNTKVEVIETVASGKWAKIKFNDSYAYVSCTYLQ